MNEEIISIAKNFGPVATFDENLKPESDSDLVRYVYVKNNFFISLPSIYVADNEVFIYVSQDNGVSKNSDLIKLLKTITHRYAHSLTVKKIEIFNLKKLIRL